MTFGHSKDPRWTYSILPLAAAALHVVLGHFWQVETWKAPDQGRCTAALMNITAAAAADWPRGFCQGD